jgi:HKD family nuclease
VADDTFVPQTLFRRASGEAHVAGLPVGFDIGEELSRADSVHLATAYGHMSGWKLVKDGVLGCRGRVYLLTGLNHDLTEPRLLADWLAAAREDVALARVFDCSGLYFHPKVLLVNAESSNRQKLRFAIVGSGNLSKGGLLANVECSAYIDRSDSLSQLKSWFDHLFCVATPITKDLIAEYEPCYKNAMRHEARSRKATSRLRSRVLRKRALTVERNASATIRDGTEFHVINTNIRYDPKAHEHMLRRHRACAYEEGWMEKIRKIKKGDIVFLYRSMRWHAEVPGGAGIVALGIATGVLEERPSKDTSCTGLEEFRRVYPPISAHEITAMNGRPVTFGQVWQRPNRELARALYMEALRRSS